MVDKKEIWKDIPNYEGIYQASNLGRIKSIKTGKIRKNVQYGLYLSIQLCKNGKNKLHYVHRLIALTFIPNPSNKPQINHINGIKTDNRVENLEWTTQSENVIHAIKIGLKTEEQVNKSVNAMKKKNSKVLLQIKNGKIVGRFKSAREASRLLHMSCGAISMCANGQFQTMYGYEWRYE